MRRFPGSLHPKDWVRAQPLSGEPKSVLNALVDRDGPKGCFPSHETLRADTGWSKDTLTKCLTYLEEQGYIERHQRRRANGSQASDEYFFHNERGVIEPTRPYKTKRQPGAGDQPRPVTQDEVRGGPHPVTQDAVIEWGRAVRHPVPQDGALYAHDPVPQDDPVLSQRRPCPVAPPPLNRTETSRETSTSSSSTSSSSSESSSSSDDAREDDELGLPQEPVAYLDGDLWIDPEVDQLTARVIRTSLERIAGRLGIASARTQLRVALTITQDPLELSDHLAVICQQEAS